MTTDLFHQIAFKKVKGVFGALKLVKLCAGLILVGAEFIFLFQIRSPSKPLDFTENTTVKRWPGHGFL